MIIFSATILLFSFIFVLISLIFCGCATALTQAHLQMTLPNLLTYLSSLTIGQQHQRISSGGSWEDVSSQQHSAQVNTIIIKKKTTSLLPILEFSYPLSCVQFRPGVSKLRPAGQIRPARLPNPARLPTIGLALHPARKISCLAHWGPSPSQRSFK